MRRAARLSDLLPRLPGALTHVFVPYGVIDPEKCAVLQDALDAGLMPVSAIRFFRFTRVLGIRLVVSLVMAPLCCVIVAADKGRSD